MKFILYWLLLIICFVLSFMHLRQNPEDLGKIADKQVKNCIDLEKNLR